MKLEIISHNDLIDSANTAIVNKAKKALFESGIIGIRDVPRFVETNRDYINAARQFSSLSKNIKEQYAPDRDAGDTEGYEQGAEWFKDQNGDWQIDDKKISYYAFVPDQPQNKWPREIDLKTPYLALGKLIFETGKHLLNFIGINDSIGIPHHELAGYGRMLHYQKENDTHAHNPNWCGAHFDHGVFTGLAPAYYFKNGEEVEEPKESGLYIMPTNSKEFIKVDAADKSILFFQVGEFGQLIMNDHIRATKHLVKKAKDNIERFTFALFYSCSDNIVIHSTSELTKDARYADNKLADGRVYYKKWGDASFARYRAR
ncbi:hypothetical protein AYO45_01050 [Gammaproteobacteria bacterium SCGC AG-212-F23]|nr:hypothetical protein AYO45_01050 [Gammaproteobacteria bacterium SCGC AG-212-F23]